MLWSFRHLVTSLLVESWIIRIPWMFLMGRNISKFLVRKNPWQKRNDVNQGRHDYWWSKISVSLTSGTNQVQLQAMQFKRISAWGGTALWSSQVHDQDQAVFVWRKPSLEDNSPGETALICVTISATSGS